MARKTFNLSALAAQYVGAAESRKVADEAGLTSEAQWRDALVGTANLIREGCSRSAIATMGSKITTERPDLAYTRMFPTSGGVVTAHELAGEILRKGSLSSESPIRAVVGAVQTKGVETDEIRQIIDGNSSAIGAYVGVIEYAESVKVRVKAEADQAVKDAQNAAKSDEAALRARLKEEMNAEIERVKAESDARIAAAERAAREANGEPEPVAEPETDEAPETADEPETDATVTSLPVVSPAVARLRSIRDDIDALLAESDPDGWPADAYAVADEIIGTLRDLLEIRVAAVEEAAG